MLGAGFVIHVDHFSAEKKRMGSARDYLQAFLGSPFWAGNMTIATDVVHRFFAYLKAKHPANSVV